MRPFVLPLSVAIAGIISFLSHTKALKMSIVACAHIVRTLALTTTLLNSTLSRLTDIMKLSKTECKFLAEAILSWSESKPCVPGVPLMFTDSTGEKCLLTNDQIETLYHRLNCAH